MAECPAEYVKAHEIANRNFPCQCEEDGHQGSGYHQPDCPARLRTKAIEAMREYAVFVK